VAEHPSTVEPTAVSADLFPGMAAAMGRRGVALGGTALSWALGALVTVLVAWIAVSALTVTSGELGRTVDDVYVVATDGEGAAPEPPALLAGAQLALGEELVMEEVDRDASSSPDTTAWEICDHLLGVPVGRACAIERVVEVAEEESRSWAIVPGGC